MTIDILLRSDIFDTWRTTLNTVVTRWNNLGTYDAITITGGNIDNTVIGNATPNAGNFTNVDINGTLDIRGAAFQLDDDAISGDKIAGGTMTVDNVTVDSFDSGNDSLTPKSYVDTQLDAVENDIIAFSIVFGG